jgi:hypothetical protein
MKLDYSVKKGDQGMNPRDLPKKSSPDSLIIDLENKTKPLGVTMALDLGDVINRLGKEYICIGSGEPLDGKKTFKVEEIRATIVRQADLATVRVLFQKMLQPKLKNGKDIVIKGVLSTQDKSSPKVEETGDHASILLKETNMIVRPRFNKENLKFIRDIAPSKVADTEVYAFGLALQTKSKQWELLGRALLPVEMKK